MSYQKNTVLIQLSQSFLKVPCSVQFCIMELKSSLSWELSVNILNSRPFLLCACPSYHQSAIVHPSNHFCFFLPLFSLLLGTICCWFLWNDIFFHVSTMITKLFIMSMSYNGYHPSPMNTSHHQGPISLSASFLPTFGASILFLSLSLSLSSFYTF